MEIKDDALRCRFTAWIEVVIKRAKIDYIRKQNKYPETVPIDSVTEDELNPESDFYNKIVSTESFEFDNENVAAAFYGLSLTRRRILTLMFVQGKSAEQVAAILGCSIKHVFNEKSLALKKIRDYLGRK